MASSRLALTIAPVGKPLVPNSVEWLRSEMLKTRVAHRYCSRQVAAEACPYANICEQCDNFVTTTEFFQPSKPSSPTSPPFVTTPPHARVITSIQGHLDRLKRHDHLNTRT